MLMSVRVEYFGGPLAKEVLELEDIPLRQIKQVYIGEAETLFAPNRLIKNDVIKYGTYHLYPMVCDGLKYFIYVYEDSLDDFKAQYNL